MLWVFATLYTCCGACVVHMSNIHSHLHNTPIIPPSLSPCFSLSSLPRPFLPPRAVALLRSTHTPTVSTRAFSRMQTHTRAHARTHTHSLSRTHMHSHTQLRINTRVRTHAHTHPLARARTHARSLSLTHTHCPSQWNIQTRSHARACTRTLSPSYTHIARLNGILIVVSACALSLPHRRTLPIPMGTW